MIQYYKLTDKTHKNMIIKIDGECQFAYVYGYAKWVETGLFGHYNWPSDDLFGQYEEIKEAEALKLIDEISHEYGLLKEKAFKIASEAHQGQLDKGGSPYIEHVLKVAEIVDMAHHNDEFYIVALLHDVIEDTDMTFSDIKNFGFNERIVHSLKALTKRKSETYENYLKRVRQDSAARAVKIADLTHNSDLSRIKEPSQADYDRIKKYEKALAFLR